MAELADKMQRVSIAVRTALCNTTILTKSLQQAPSMAGKQIAVTYELAQIVLSKLPVKDLVMARKVCKAWQDIIARSVPIQKALYKEPGTVHDVSFDGLTPKWLNGKQVTRTAQKKWQAAWLDRIRSGIIVNPLLISVFTTSVTGKGTRILLTIDKNRIKSALGGAECGDMYFTQPPLQAFTIWYTNGERQCVLEGVPGGTLGHTLARLERKIESGQVVHEEQELTIEAYLPEIRFAYA